ncbi:MAG TPA: SCO1664 family protein [Longilinea sp.]|nr:SCO1664 family protein [Longilinea sp.]
MTALGEKDTILAALQNGALTVQGQFINGSNYTFLGEVQSPTGAVRVVYKPVRGEQPLWDFPARSLARREVAAYLVSEALGWGLVPPTVFRKRGPLGSGSVQLFVNHDPERHYFSFTSQEKERLKPAAAFDVLINNADRKGGHLLIGEDGHLWLIDHGICFHVDDKLRTVIWDFAGQPVPGDLLEDIRRFLTILELDDSPLRTELKPLLKTAEIRRLASRGQALLTNPVFPLPDRQNRPYPWPPV